jgi:hypothetical protein
MKTLLSILFLTTCLLGQAQQKLSFDGQLSAFTSYTASEGNGLFAALRYIPELNYEQQLDTFSSISFEASVNTNVFWGSEGTDASLSPYRLWVRYSAKQFEIRAGLQKIEFGSASILRPLQWFNQIDPRDPLQLTNGVYGLLGRYYFLNNANIWVWGLYGNEQARGFDPLENNGQIPEYGGRIQYPVPRGELAMTYHHRTADSRSITFLPAFEKIPEDRLGLDGKWDLGVGLWFEAAQLWKHEDLGPLNYQTSFNIGMDYTFGLGNGLAAIVENMTISSDENLMEFKEPINFTAATLAYPLGFFDSISTVLFYSWKTQDATFFLNYEHQFSNWSMYIMAYYNPETAAVGVQQNDLVYTFAGPGIRLMAVYNH